MEAESNAEVHPFFADRPIEARSDDRLGRAHFAEALAGAIGGWQERDSLVIALYGGWGSGKTSIKNMTLEALSASPMDVHAIEFNPWEWSSQDRLFEAFFREIGSAVGRLPESEASRLRRWAEKWQEYGAYLQAGATVADGLRRLLAIVVAVSAAGWLVPGLGIASFAPLHLLVAIALLAFAAFLGWGGRFANQVAEAIMVSSNRRTRTTTEIKSELRQAFKRAKHTILVVIDDIDRVPADQILSVFQLVKANADFPGVVYLLLFDRTSVEDALETSGAVTPNFIEKIVQVGFDVPIVEQQRLEGVLFAELDKLFVDTARPSDFQQDRWSVLFLEGMRPYFQTMRQVKRYLSSLSFHTSLLARSGTLEVNHIDLIGLEALRVFEMALYRELPRAKALLTGEDPTYGLGGENVDQQKKADLKRLANLVPEERRGAAMAVLYRLFPAVERLTSRFGGGNGDHESWVREARVCSPEFFARYFQLSIPVGDISRYELEDILSVTGDQEELLKRLLGLKDRNLLTVAIERLDAYKQNINIEHAVPFTAALFDVGDWLNDEPDGFFDIKTITHASRIIYWYLHQQVDNTIRGQLILEAAKRSRGLQLIVRTVSSEESRREKGAQHKYLVDDDHLKDLRNLCVERIEKAARDGSIETQRELISLLYRWKEWAGAEQPKKWVASLLSTPEGTIRFLVAVTTPYRVNGKRRWQVRLKYIEDFTDLECLKAAVDAGFPRQLEEEEIRAVEEFRKALRRRSAGKGDDRWLDDEED